MAGGAWVAPLACCAAGPGRPGRLHRPAPKAAAACQLGGQAYSLMTWEAKLRWIPPHTTTTPPPHHHCSYASLLQEEGLQPQVACPWPSWQSSLRAGEPHREEHDSSVVIDHSFESGALSLMLLLAAAAGYCGSGCGRGLLWLPGGSECCPSSKRCRLASIWPLPPTAPLQTPLQTTSWMRCGPSCRTSTSCLRHRRPRPPPRLRQTAAPSRTARLAARVASPRSTHPAAASATAPHLPA